MEDFLRAHIEEVVAIDDAEYNYVSQYFVPKRIRKHQYLIQAGDAVSQSFLVEKGLLKSLYINADGKEHIIAFAMENWWITDVEPACARAL